jgi:hypothetical protein
MMIGVVLSCWRKCLTKVSPSMLGMFQSTSSSCGREGTDLAERVLPVARLFEIGVAELA